MKILYIILIIAAFVSCGNNPKANKSKTDKPAESATVEKEKLDSILVQGVLDLVETKEYLNYPEIPLSESSIVICFFVDPERANINFSDTIAVIYYNALIRNDISSYKGTLDIDGINVIILDYCGFGGQYYNVDSLQQIPLDNFKSYPMKYKSTIMFYIRDGKLFHWNP